MKLSHVANCRGVIGQAGGVTSIKDLFYEAVDDAETAIREISSAGYSGIEMFDGDVLSFPGGVEALRSSLERSGLVLTAVYVGANFIYPQIFEEELWRIRQGIEAAQKAGAPYLVVGGGAKRSTGVTHEDWLELARALDITAGLAADHGLVAVFHPHLGTCAESPKAVRAVLDNSSIKLCPDTAHLSAGGADVNELIRTYADRIPYVHLKDYVAEPFGFVPLGLGTMDVRGILQTLSEINYRGWITVEADGYAGDAESSVLTSKGYLEQTIAENYGGNLCTY